MARAGGILIFAAAAVFALPWQFAQTTAKSSFDVVSIKPSAPGQRGRGGGIRGAKSLCKSRLTTDRGRTG